jgi:hypothetical protein
MSSATLKLDPSSIASKNLVVQGLPPPWNAKAVPPTHSQILSPHRLVSFTTRGPDCYVCAGFGILNLQKTRGCWESKGNYRGYLIGAVFFSFERVTIALGNSSVDD